MVIMLHHQQMQDINGGIKFQGYNGNDFTQARSAKCAGVFAVSEDTGAGYNRNVGLAFHTSQFDTASS